MSNFKHSHYIDLYCVFVHTVFSLGDDVMVPTWLESTQKKDIVFLVFFYFYLFCCHTDCLPGWMWGVDCPVFSLVHGVQVLQSPQGAASRQRTPECILGCPRRLLAIWYWW